MSSHSRAFEPCVGTEEEEEPRPEFIRSYFTGSYAGEEYGGKGVMRYRRGFFDDNGNFISHPDADNELVMSP